MGSTSGSGNGRGCSCPNLKGPSPRRPHPEQPRRDIAYGDRVPPAAHELRTVEAAQFLRGRDGVGRGRRSSTGPGRRSEVRPRRDSRRTYQENPGRLVGEIRRDGQRLPDPDQAADRHGTRVPQYAVSYLCYGCRQPVRSPRWVRAVLRGAGTSSNPGLIVRARTRPSRCGAVDRPDGCLASCLGKPAGNRTGEANGKSTGGPSATRPNGSVSVRAAQGSPVQTSRIAVVVSGRERPQDLTPADDLSPADGRDPDRLRTSSTTPGIGSR